MRYKVIQQAFQTAKALEDELNTQFKQGFEVLQIWLGPGDFTNVVFKPKPNQNFGN